MPNNFCRRLGLTTPIILAPMAGGPGTPELAAAVSNAGGLGFLGVNYLTPRQIEEAINRTRRLTKNIFGVNLFAPESSQPLSGDIDSAMAFLANRMSKNAAKEPDSVSRLLWIDISTGDVSDLDFFEGIFFAKYNVNQPKKQSKLYEIQYELERSLLNRKKHYYDFLTYDGMTRTRALKKAGVNVRADL